MKTDKFSNDDKIMRYLDELSAEYKELLFKALVEQSSTVNDLSVSELLRIDNEVKKPLIANYRRNKRQRQIILLIGIVYVLCGFCCFFFYQLYKQIISSSFNEESLVLLLCSVISLLGLFVCMYSYIMPHRIRQKETGLKNTHNMESTALIEYEIISKWRDIEGLVSDLSVNSHATSPSSAINYLRQNGMIDESEQDTLKQLLRLRNMVVHSGKDPIPIANARTLMRQTDQVLDKLRKVLQ